MKSFEVYQKVYQEKSSLLSFENWQKACTANFGDVYMYHLNYKWYNFGFWNRQWFESSNV